MGVGADGAAPPNRASLLGTCGFSGDGDDATEAEIKTPADIALSCDGNLAFAEPLNSRLRVVSGISSGGPAPDTDNDGLGYICE